MYISPCDDHLKTSPLCSFGWESTRPLTPNIMNTKTSLPTVRAYKSFTGKDGRAWTKFLLSNGKEHLEQGIMQSPFVVTSGMYKGKKQLTIWSAGL